MADWAQVFLPDTPVLEIVVRGSVMYLSLFVLLRVVLKRESGTTGVTDLLVIVLLADAAQNGMSGGYNSIGDGLLLVGVIIVWAYLLDAVAYRWAFAAKLIRPGPLLLVRDGRPLRRNMRRPEPTNPDQLYITSNFGKDPIFALQDHHGYPKLADYLNDTLPGFVKEGIKAKAQEFVPRRGE